MLSDGLFAPRAVRSDCEIGRRLLQLEIPEDCGCDCSPIDCGCDGPCDCPVRPPPPCPHVLGRDHRLSTRRWAALLAAFDPAGYDDPPPPAAPSQVASRRARVALYEERARARLGLYHPADMLRDAQADDVAVLTLKGRREAGVTGRRAA